MQRRPSLLLLLGLLMTGCATIISGSKQTLTFRNNSNVPLRCSAPNHMPIDLIQSVLITLPADQDSAITVYYRDHARALKVPRRFNHWTLLNLLFGGFPGLVDIFSGAIHRVDDFAVRIDESGNIQPVYPSRYR
jgi:hypothetical protein